MRVTDERYDLDRRRQELALRLVGHDARTQTVRRWTGLSDERVRKLIRDYIRFDSGLQRHRGKSPQQVNFFLRNERTLSHAHALASLFVLFGAYQPSVGRSRAPSIKRGSLLCDAFECYQRSSPTPCIDLEHADFLLQALHRGDEIRLCWCSRCEALNLTEYVRLRSRPCRVCGNTLPSPWRAAARMPSSAHPP